MYDNLKLLYQAATMMDQGANDALIRQKTGIHQRDLAELHAWAQRLEILNLPRQSSRISVIGHYMLLRSAHGTEDIAVPTTEQAAEHLGEQDPTIITSLLQQMNDVDLITTVPGTIDPTPEGFIEPKDWEGQPSSLLSILMKTAPEDGEEDLFHDTLYGSMTSLDGLRILIESNNPAVAAPLAMDHTPSWPSDKIIYIEFQPPIIAIDNYICPGVLVTAAHPAINPRVLLLPIYDGTEIHVAMFGLDLSTGDLTDIDDKHHTGDVVRESTLPIRQAAALLSSPEIQLVAPPLTRSQRNRLRKKNLPNPWLVPALRSGTDQPTAPPSPPDNV